VMSNKAVDRGRIKNREKNEKKEAGGGSNRRVDTDVQVGWGEKKKGQGKKE